MHLHKTSIRPAPPGMSFSEKSGVVTALCPITANLIIAFTNGVSGIKKWSGVILIDGRSFRTFRGRTSK